MPAAHKDHKNGHTPPDYAKLFTNRFVKAALLFVYFLKLSSDLS